MTIRVVVADDEDLVRQGLVLLLERDGDIVVVGQARDGDQAVRCVSRERPDVVIMDVRMPGLDGIQATSQIVGTVGLDTRVIMLTTFDTDEYIFEALRVGASGFLLKDASPEELRQTVRTVAAGDALLAPRVTTRVVGTFASRITPALDRQVLAPLTDREREILYLVGHGLDNDQIAARLFVSPATVKTHVNRSMTKLGVHDRAQLVVIAYETGLVVPGTPP